MPKVPTQNYLDGPMLAGPKPADALMLMAAATMNELGRLERKPWVDRTEPDEVQDAAIVAAERTRRSVIRER